MKETIHYIADIRYVSGITSDRYSSKRQVVEAHIRYVEKSADYEFGDKNLIVQNSDKYNKRVNSRVAGKTVFALPNDIRREEYEKWCKYIQSVISENFKVNPEYIYIAIHENHSLQEELGTKNLHAHVVFTPITRDGKAIQTKISDLKAIHQSWRQILAKEGYSIKKEQESIGKLSWKLRKDEEMLAAYKEYVNSKKEQQQAVRLAKSASLANTEIGIIADIEVVENEPSPNYSPSSPSPEPPRQLEPPRQPQPQKPTRQPEKPQPVKPEPQPENIEKKKKEIQNMLSGKSITEAIAIVRSLRKSENDREIQRYLDNILDNLNRKAAEILKQRQSVQKTEPETTSKEKVLSYQNDSKKIAEYIQKPEKSEITTAKEENVQKKEKQPVHREPELPVQRQPQPQPQSQPTRQPQPQRQPIRQPENIAHEREEREKRNFATRIHRIVKIAKEVNSDDVLAMIMSDETNKDEKTARVLAVLYNFVLNKEMKSGKDRHQQTEQQTEETESKQEQKEQKEQNTGLKTNLDKGWWNPGI